MDEELLNQWDYIRNGDLDPRELPRRSTLRVWWTCLICGGHWEAAVKDRSGGTNCPYCAGRKVLKGFNDFASQYEKIAEQWISSEHGKRPDEVTAGSDERVRWKCEKGHCWETSVSTRVKGCGCPYCTGRLPVPGVNDFQTLCNDLMPEWNWEKNVVAPDQVMPFSMRKIWWKCQRCGYEWQASPSDRNRRDRKAKKGRGCPACNHKAAIPGINDAATYNAEAVKDWDAELNGGRKLSSYLPASNKSAFWTCHTCGQTWKAQIQSRVVHKKGCPYCAGKRPIPHKTDLVTTSPVLAEEWNYEMNGSLMPEDVTAYSHKKVWWECRRCGHEWRATVANRVLGKGCPHCAPNRPE